MSDQHTSKYELEAIVSFDDRGQLVIPKDLRKKFNLKSGDKFALVSCTPSDASCCSTDDSQSSCCDSSSPNQICCFSLIHTNQLKGLISDFMAPAMSGLKR